MTKIGRLIELMLTLSSKKKYTVQQLAQQFNVSSRTMLRDLHMLSEIGLPLSSSTGPSGGYQMINSYKLPFITLSPEEAVGLIISYDSLTYYPESPFKKESLSTLTKIRSSLSIDTLAKVKELEERLVFDSPNRSIKNPYITELLKASINREHLLIEYESLSGYSKRIIFPYGLMFSNGLWYCISYCYKREDYLVLRTDRMLSIEKVDPPIESERISKTINANEALKLIGRNSKPSEKINLKASLTKKACKLIDPEPTIGEMLKINQDGTGYIDTEIAITDIPWYGRLFLGLGKEIRVKKPHELKEWMKQQAKEILELY